MTKFNQIFLDRDLDITPEIDYLLEKVNLTPEKVTDSRPVYDLINQADDPVGFAKTILYFTSNKGACIRKCPGTSYYTCCDYTILHCGTFCTMDCAYCILQAYFHPPVLQYFAGLDLMGAALDQVFSEDRIYRIGTGEYTDSLIWEPISRMPGFLVEKFGQQDHAVLELKTKTVCIDSLLDLPHNRKTILSWSVNTPKVIASEERGTATLAARLKAAAKAVSKGFRVAFHFDPIILYPGCEEEYEKVVETIFNHVAPADVVWISIGTFRFMPHLKPIIEQRFPDSTIPYGEFITGLDNKMRYFKPVRIAIYQRLAKVFKQIAPGVTVYFCMEDEEVWQKTFGFFPNKPGQLGAILDKAAADRCRLDSCLL